MSALLFDSRHQFLDGNADPAAGFIRFFEAGTTTLFTVYSDSALTTAVADNLPLNADGRLPNSIYVPLGQDIFWQVRTGASGGGSLIAESDDSWGWPSVNSDTSSSIADMKTRTPDDGDVVTVHGYTTVGDGGGGTYHFDASSVLADNGGTVIAPNAGSGRWLLMSEVIRPEHFGAVGTGDVSSAMALAITGAGSSPLTLSGTYTLSDNVTFEHVISDNATLYLADTTTLGDISFVSLSAGGSIEGTLNIDGNRSNNNQVIYGLALKGGDHTVDTVSANNCYGVGVRGFDCGDSTVNSIKSDNCGGGAWLTFGNQGGRVDEIVCTNMDSNISGLIQHAVEIDDADYAHIGSIRVIDADGGNAGTSTALTAVLVTDFDNSTIDSIHVENMQSTTLTPLAVSMLGLYGSAIRNVTVRGYEGARQLECKGWTNSILDKAFVHMRYNVATGVGAVASSTGLFTSNDPANTNGSNNSFENITIINGNLGVRDGGFGNTYKNVQCLGAATDGFSFIEVNESTFFPNVATGFGQKHGGHTLVGCRAKGCGRAGMYLDDAIDSLYASVCDFSGNGTDTTATAATRAGVYYQGADNSRIRLHNCKLADEHADWTVTNGLSANDADVTAVESEFTVWAIQGTAGMYPGQVLQMNDAKPGTGNMTIRVNELLTLDSFTAIAEDASTGAINQRLITPTGTQIEGTSAGTTLTGTGTTFNADIPGRYWWFITESGRHRASSVANDTTCGVTPALTATFTSATLRLLAWTQEGVQRQQYGYSGNEITMVGCDVFGNANAAPASGVTLGVFEVGTVSVNTATTATYTYQKTYAVAPKVIVTPVDGAAGVDFSISTPSTTSVDVYNAAGATKTFHVLVIA